MYSSTGSIYSSTLYLEYCTSLSKWYYLMETPVLEYSSTRVMGLWETPVEYSQYWLYSRSTLYSYSSTNGDSGVQYIRLILIDHHNDHTVLLTFGFKFQSWLEQLAVTSSERRKWVSSGASPIFFRESLLDTHMLQNVPFGVRTSSWIRVRETPDSRVLGSPETPEYSRVYYSHSGAYLPGPSKVTHIYSCSDMSNIWNSSPSEATLMHVAIVTKIWNSIFYFFSGIQLTVMVTV